MTWRGRGIIDKSFLLLFCKKEALGLLFLFSLVVGKQELTHPTDVERPARIARRRPFSGRGLG
jgi:hypothetical protein